MYLPHLTQSLLQFPNEPEVRACAVSDSILYLLDCEQSANKQCVVEIFNLPSCTPIRKIGVHPVRQVQDKRILGARARPEISGEHHELLASRTLVRNHTPPVSPASSPSTQGYKIQDTRYKNTPSTPNARLRTALFCKTQK